MTDPIEKSTLSAEAPRPVPGGFCMAAGDPRQRSDREFTRPEKTVAKAGIRVYNQAIGARRFYIYFYISCKNYDEIRRNVKSRKSLILWAFLNMMNQDETRQKCARTYPDNEAIRGVKNAGSACK